MEDIIYRLATPKDVEKINRVVGESVQDGFSGIIRQQLLSRMPLSNFMPPLNMKLPGDAVREVSVLEVNRAVVGVSLYGLRTDLELSRRYAEIQALYLLSDYWGRGLGQGLLQHSFMRLNRHQYRSVVAWAFANNHRAARCFIKAGLRPDGAVKRVAYGGGDIQMIRYAGYMQNG